MVGEQLHDKTTEGYLQRLLSFPPDTSVHNTWSYSLYNKTFSICTVIQKMTAKHTQQQMLHTNRVTLTDTHHHTCLHTCSDTRNFLRMFKIIVHKAQNNFCTIAYAPEYVNNSMSFNFHVLLFILLKEL